MDDGGQGIACGGGGSTAVGPLCRARRSNQRRGMKRRFNTAGPCIAGMHYMIPPERRLPEAPSLVEQLGYFVVYAPRQTGKTTALRALAQNLTASGSYAAVL